MGSFLVKDETIIAVAKSITRKGLHEFYQITTKDSSAIEELYNVLKEYEASGKFDSI